MKWLWVAAVACLVAAAAACSSEHPAAYACAVSADCTDLAAPYCVLGECVGCNGAGACTPDLPVCAAESHVCAACAGDDDCSAYPTLGRCAANGCVQCLDSTDCAADAPVCDPSTHACRGCAMDSECPSQVCDSASGVCAPVSSVIFVAPDGTAAGSCGAQTMPCTIGTAFTLVDGTRDVISMTSGNYVAAELTLAGSLNAKLFGHGASLMSTATTAAINVNDGAALKIVALAVDAPDGAGVACTTGGANVPSLTLDGVTVHAEREGVTLEPCLGTIEHSTVFPPSSTAHEGVLVYNINGHPATLTMRSTVLKGGAIGVEALQGAVFHIENCVFENISASAVTLGAVGTPSGDVSFSTFVNSKVLCGNGPQTITLSNNIIYSTAVGDVSTGSGCVHHYSLLSPQSETPSGDHLFLNMNPMLKDVANGDFHLTSGSPAIDAADPAATLDVDFDGVGRPQGARRDLGAFEFKP